MLIGFPINIFASTNSSDNNLDESYQRLSTAIYSHKKMDGAIIQVRACINVTIHDITLVECGTNGPQVSIASGEGVNGGRAYMRLIDFAHANMGLEPEDLPVYIKAKYEAGSAEDGFSHKMKIYDFKTTN
ncbi:hypothetical protein [Xanthomonas arboricola]|uniref:hypothetical protein n=1 Tax=Xanthomonas arboricola TaxID=56448 RepID=UPI00143000CC|nr:hypothetical protein [Xanthomonas arboricola]NJB81000.1 hypothetical protein [Xanthomonas arboricola]